MKPLRPLLAALLLVLPTPLLAQALRPASAGSLAELDLLLQRLGQHRRLLVVGAHPDDEDTDLLALVAQGMGGEAAYLSLTRGEGGQNLIGDELGVELGVLRTGELLAARGIDGARQYFARAYDFGYTRSLEETFERWPREILLEDAVRVARRFRPQVVVAVFPPTEAAGHGQHQASGVVAEALMGLSDDPSRFPRLAAEEGLPPWRIDAFYRRTWWDPTLTTLEVPVAPLELRSGRSIHQIAMESRSQHRSQDMGRIQPLGAQSRELAWVAGGAGPGGGELFAGIDTSLRSIAALLPEGEGRERLAATLRDVEEAARAQREGLTAGRRPELVAGVAEIVTALRSAVEALAGADPGTVAARELLDEKIRLAERALIVSAGVAVDAFTEQEVLVPGEPVEVLVQLWNAGRAPIVVGELGWRSDPGWSPGAPAEEPGPVGSGELAEWKVPVEVTPEAVPTRPYSLRSPLRGDLYDWSAVSPELRGLPEAPPPLRLALRLEIVGCETTVLREVVARTLDQAEGEVRRPLRAAPPVEIAVHPERVLAPRTALGGRELEAILVSHSWAALRGRVEVALPAGWPASPPQDLRLAERGERRVLHFPLVFPPDVPAGRFEASFTVVLESGERWRLGSRAVEYRHIRPVTLPVEADVDLRVVDVAVPPLSRVAYVRGASDRVPEALLEIGVPLEIVAAEELPARDLTRYDAVVIGSRAYEVEPALEEARGVLLDYLEGGGRVVVQYQQYGFVRAAQAPYPLELERPHDRVTDETAPVRLLRPDHPVFHVPNEIGPEDWDGWVQERSLYMPHSWDDAYTPLLELPGPGGEPLRSAILVAKVGKGTYVYTSLAFFRQLPAGVPGALRLFANLLSR